MFKCKALILAMLLIGMSSASHAAQVDDEDPHSDHRGFADARDVEHQEDREPNELSPCFVIRNPPDTVIASVNAISTGKNS